MASDPSDAFGIPVRYEPGLTLPFVDHLASSNNLDEWERLIKQAWDDQFCPDTPADNQLEDHHSPIGTGPRVDTETTKTTKTTVNEWESRTGPKPNKETLCDSSDDDDYDDDDPS